MSRSTERAYRESGEELYDEADKGEPVDSDQPTRIDRRSGRQKSDQDVG
jgi:hypothetical protein